MLSTTTIKAKSWLAFALAVFSFPSIAVLPETCIQDPGRSLACPRIIYKTADLPDLDTGTTRNKVVCICLTDFQDWLVEPESEVEKKLKHMKIQSWTAQLGISEEKIKELIRY